MTAQELLKPRFEVIADYPFNPHEIGSIIESKTESLHQTTTTYWNEFSENVKCENYCPICSFEKYPHLFRKLNWWEKRAKEDMPTKLISKADNKGSIFEIVYWDMEIMHGIIDVELMQVCSLLLWSPEYGYFPID